MAALPSALPGTFTYAQAREAGLSKRGLYSLRDAGELELVGRGLYRRADAPLSDVDLAEVVLRAPNATLCLETALARHGLSDALVAAPDIALPRGTRPPRTSSPVQWHAFAADTFALGRELLSIDAQVAIGLYSPERSIVDAFRLRGREGHAVANEALRRWLRQRNTQPATLLALAKRLPRALTPLQRALEVLL